jgi:hypothetical protein
VQTEAGCDRRVIDHCGIAILAADARHVGEKLVPFPFGAHAADANPASIAAHTTSSNGSRNRLRRVHRIAAASDHNQYGHFMNSGARYWD